MDEEKRKKTLAAMRAALKGARSERKLDKEHVADWIDYEIRSLRQHGGNTSDGLNEAMHLASNRKMLHEIRVENRYGEETEIMAVKEREEYKKRPSVRALKKQRSKGAGGVSL